MDACRHAADRQVGRQPMLFVMRIVHVNRRYEGRRGGARVPRRVPARRRLSEPVNTDGTMVSRAVLVEDESAVFSDAARLLQMGHRKAALAVEYRSSPLRT